MKIILLCVGRVRHPLAEAVAEFEGRARRYFSLEAVEVKEEPATRGKTPDMVMEAEAKRLLARVPAGYELVALHRGGKGWSSEGMAEYLEQLGLRAAPGVALVIGGAFGLAPSLLAQATRLLSISQFTLTHELARLVLAEQLYRAGTILRGEPYHKGTGR